MSGFFALLDDIATLAKLTLSTLDDTASMAVKTTAKVSAAAVDDVAATPQYVTGITPDRELPIIRRIALGSLRNKLLVILPVGLLLSWLAPAVLPVALVAGGMYLCFEGGEKVLGGVLGPEHADDEDQPKDEDAVVRRAVTTDMVLSTEIMLLALAQVQGESSLRRVVALVLIALLITFAVYGLVGALIKLDDAGIHLARRSRIPAVCISSLAFLTRSAVGGRGGPLCVPRPSCSRSSGFSERSRCCGSAVRSSPTASQSSD